MKSFTASNTQASKHTRNRTKFQFLFPKTHVSKVVHFSDIFDSFLWDNSLDFLHLSWRSFRTGCKSKREAVYRKTDHPHALSHTVRFLPLHLNPHRHLLTLPMSICMCTRTNTVCFMQMLHQRADGWTTMHLPLPYTVKALPRAMHRGCLCYATQ